MGGDRGLQGRESFDIVNYRPTKEDFPRGQKVTSVSVTLLAFRVTFLIFLSAAPPGSPESSGFHVDGEVSSPDGVPAVLPHVLDRLSILLWDPSPSVWSGPVSLLGERPNQVSKRE